MVFGSAIAPVAAAVGVDSAVEVVQVDFAVVVVVVIVEFVLVIVDFGFRSVGFAPVFLSC